MKKENVKSRQGKVKRGFFIVAGTIFLGLGVIGIIIPLLPTTPFLLLSAACYYKTSERMHRWMLSNKLFGSYLKNYKEGRGLPLRTKVFIITLLWVTISYSAVYVVDTLVIQLALFIIAVAVSIHIATLPTFRKAK